MQVSEVPKLCGDVSQNKAVEHAVSIKHGLRTTDYGLSIKHGLGYKTRTEHYGLGIKHGLRYEQALTGCKLN